MLNLILLQEMAEDAQQGSGWSIWIMMFLIFGVMYFLMIRPQQKRQKELQQKREALKKGDKIITAGGIYGEIKEVQETAFIILVSKDVTLKVDKSSVQPIEVEPASEKADEKK